MAYLVAARYGAMHNISNFISSTADLKAHDRVLLKTERGTEAGEIISPPEYVMRGTDVSSCGEVVRKMTKKDDEVLHDIESNKVPEEFEHCRSLIREGKISMKLANVEHLFGGEKIIFYFLADGRVDFRQLVKDLASKYHTRIEMRQIGVRDEARLLAEIEHCGQPLCCKRFMHELAPVTMRMAKAQKTTLDPAKISGRCGRLMCCLRFEDETYCAYKAEMPRKGDLVATAGGKGRVVGHEIITRTLTVELEDGTETKVSMDDVQEVCPCKGGNRSCTDDSANDHDDNNNDGSADSQEDDSKSER